VGDVGLELLPGRIQFSAPIRPAVALESRVCEGRGRDGLHNHCPDAVIGVVDFYSKISSLSSRASAPSACSLDFGLTDEAAGRAGGLR
jgi:hypothetical protein